MFFARLVVFIPTAQEKPYEKVEGVLKEVEDEEYNKLYFERRNKNFVEDDGGMCAHGTRVMMM